MSLISNPRLYQMCFKNVYLSEGVHGGERLGSPRIRVTGGCQLLNVDAGNKTWILWQSKLGTLHDSTVSPDMHVLFRATWLTCSSNIHLHVQLTRLVPSLSMLLS